MFVVVYAESDTEPKELLEVLFVVRIYRRLQNKEGLNLSLLQWLNVESVAELFDCCIESVYRVENKDALEGFC